MQSVSEFLEEQMIQILRHKPTFEKMFETVQSKIPSYQGKFELRAESTHTYANYLNLLFPLARYPEESQVVRVSGDYPCSAKELIQKSREYLHFFKSEKQGNQIRVISEDEKLRWIGFEMKQFKNNMPATLAYLYHVDSYAQDNDLSFTACGHDRNIIEALDYSSLSQSLTTVTFSRSRGSGLESTLIDEEQYKENLRNVTRKFTFNPKGGIDKDDLVGQAYFYLLQNAMQDLCTYYLIIESL